MFKFRYATTLSKKQNAVIIRSKKPQLETLKCIIDALFEDGNNFGFGICIRNSQGVMVQARTGWFIGTPSPSEAETRGTL